MIIKVPWLHDRCVACWVHFLNLAVTGVRVEIAQVYGLGQKRLAEALKLIKEHEDVIRQAWQSHFGG